MPEDDPTTSVKRNFSVVWYSDSWTCRGFVKFSAQGRGRARGADGFFDFCAGDANQISNTESGQRAVWAAARNKRRYESSMSEIYCSPNAPRKKGRGGSSPRCGVPKFGEGYFVGPGGGNGPSVKGNTLRGVEGGRCSEEPDRGAHIHLGEWCCPSESGMKGDHGARQGGGKERVDQGDQDWPGADEANHTAWSAVLASARGA